MFTLFLKNALMKMPKQDLQFLMSYMFLQTMTQQKSIQ